ncbi:transposase [Streptomyces sp. NPDC005098]|uniref:transposase n=1 Tax=Streptomyces sp. NPDC005098 TaxID=3154560 RepID=UPI0033BD2DEE
MGRGDLTDAEWAGLKPHLPKSGERGGRWARHRRIINGILYRQQTGAPWREAGNALASGPQVALACPAKTGHKKKRSTQVSPGDHQVTAACQAICGVTGNNWGSVAASNQ